MAQINLQVRASSPQDSPDIVILAGHSRIPRPGTRGANYAAALLGDMARESKRFDLSLFDLPAARA